VRHYFSIETKNLATKHKQQCGIHPEFTPWDGHQMVKTESLILYSSLKFGLKYNKTNINTMCSFRST